MVQYKIIDLLNTMKANKYKIKGMKGKIINWLEKYMEIKGWRKVRIS